MFLKFHIRMVSHLAVFQESLLCLLSEWQSCLFGICEEFGIFSGHLSLSPSMPDRAKEEGFGAGLNTNVLVPRRADLARFLSFEPKLFRDAAQHRQLGKRGYLRNSGHSFHLYAVCSHWDEEHGCVDEDESSSDQHCTDNLQIPLVHFAD